MPPVQLYYMAIQIFVHMLVYSILHISFFKQYLFLKTQKGDVGEILKFDQNKLGPNAKHPALIGVNPELIGF